MGTLSGTGVPTKRGGGNLVFRTTWFCAGAAVAKSITARTEAPLERIFVIVSGFHFFGSDGKSGLRGNSFACFVDRVFAAESFIAGAIQFCRAADGVEEVLQMRLVWRLIEEYRNFIFRQLRCFANVHLRSVRGRSRLGADISFLGKIVP